MTIIQDYKTRRSLWLELGRYQTIEMEFAANSLKLKNFLESERMLEFLVSLNPELDQVMG